MPDAYEPCDECNSSTGGSGGENGSGGTGWGSAGTSGGPNLTVNARGGVGVSVGNPINVTTGAKLHKVTDWSSSDGRLKVSRRYNSLLQGAAYLFNEDQSVGEKWSMSAFPKLRFGQGLSPNHFAFIHPNGRYVRFVCCNAGTTFVDANVRLAGGGYEIYRVDVTHDNFQGNFLLGPSTIKITDPKGAVFLFSTTVETSDVNTEHVAYKPISVEYPDGYKISYDVTLFREELFNQGRRYLARVDSASDNLGRTLNFQYNIRRFDSCDLDAELADPSLCTGPNFPINRAVQLGYISRVNLPDGTSLNYQYDGGTSWEDTFKVDRRLRRAVHLNEDDTEIWSEGYLYEDGRFPYALTGVVDAKGNRLSTYTYDEFMRANSSERAGGIGRVDLDYVKREGDNNFWDHTVTNAFGRNVTYEVLKSRLGGRYYITQAQSAETGDLAADTSTVTYANGSFRGTQFVSELTDRNGRMTTYDYDDFGHRTSMVQAAGTVDEVQMTAQYDPVTRLKSQTVVDGLTTDYVRDAAGRVTEMIATDTTSVASPPRHVSFTYDGPNLTSVDGPLPGPSDTTSYDWDGARLQRVTNPLGHVMQYFDHNEYDAPTRIVDPNGVTTLISYDARQRPVEIITDQGGRNATTEMEYDLNGQITKVTSPDGTSLSFAYDAAQRLSAIENSAGERVVYARNLMNTVTRTVVTDETGALTAEISQVTDALNRVVETIAPPTQSGLTSAALQTYDAEDNLVEVTDARGGLWVSSFDNLDRLIRETDPLGAETNYDLSDITDGRNPLSKVTDARDVETVYVRNGFGDLVREVSFESGTTEYEYDTRGLVTQMTDARGVVVNYIYDVAGRLLSEDYEGSDADDVTYEYDQGPFGIGRLTAIVEGFGRTEYAYDALGFMTSETRVIGTQNYTTQYTHDIAGNILLTTYPSGRQIEVTRDNLSRITDIAMIDISGARTDLLSAGKYRPYGGMTQALLGDGYTLDVSYDTADRAIGLSRTRNDGALMDLRFIHDGVGDILAIEDLVRPERSQTLGYDPVSRLSDAVGAYGTINYDYNLGGDRLARNWTKPDGTQRSETYSYEQMTARLLNVSTAQPNGQMTTIRDFDYYASGQVSSDQRGPNEYLNGLNDRGRISTVTRNGTEVAAYTHDISEQRIVKTANGQTIHYHYDMEGRLISETDGASGETLRDYVWLGLTPIAVIDASDDAPNPLCEADITALQAQIEDLTTRLDTNAARIPELLDLIIDKESRIATHEARITELETLIADKDTRIANNTALIAELGALITDKESRVATNAARISELGDLITDKQARIAANAARVDDLTALIAADEAEIATLDPTADAARITVLNDRIAARAASVSSLTTRNGELAALITDHETRSAELVARNTELAALITAHETRAAELTTRKAELSDLRDAHAVRAVELTTRNAELAALNTAHETRIDDLSARNITLAEQRAQLEADLAEAQAGCETGTAEGLYYLHADHLGRPQFATDPTGAVVWDMGEGVTPFGDSVNLAGAFAQQLMFPGQYADLETGGEGDVVTLSHNWHRTYDPTLGRYLQSDPIGLAGGLNRYAYVGGNPISLIDPMGLAEAIPFDVLTSSISQEVNARPIRGKNPYYAAGVVIGATGAWIAYNAIASTNETCGDDDEVTPIVAIGGDKCTQLNLKIKQVRDELAGRLNEMYFPKYDLPIQGRMSVEGHLEQFKNKQAQLRGLISEAVALGCYISTQDAYFWATRGLG